MCVCKHACTYLIQQLHIRQNNKIVSLQYTHWWRTSNAATLTRLLRGTAGSNDWGDLLQNLGCWRLLQAFLPKPGSLYTQHLTPMGTQERKYGDLVGFQKGGLNVIWLTLREKKCFLKELRNRGQGSPVRNWRFPQRIPFEGCLSVDASSMVCGKSSP